MNHYFVLIINYCVCDLRETYISYLLHQVVTLLSYCDINSMSLIAPSIPFRLVLHLNYYMINPKKTHICNIIISLKKLVLYNQV